ncbi:hypothetical protein DP939_32455 [Spongiactinospora rosea]|uniref:Holin n=1 Tax=Spongiactinospora rosea TaxID=2248750 RepID=A0A366LQC5_9ACTN|nr:hypothetical protein [Spongiactinospora rosea]RBQ16027.1 hypothetical protein DP939_32455 [Spongiactinospora rosea]
MSDDNKRAIRTALQAFVGICVALPGIVAATGIRDTIPWVAGALTVAGAVSRVMALASVQRLLPSWLRIEVATPGDQNTSR